MKGAAGCICPRSELVSGRSSLSGKSLIEGRWLTPFLSGALSSLVDVNRVAGTAFGGLAEVYEKSMY